VGMLRPRALNRAGSAAQDITADRIEVPVGSEKADDPFGLLKWLDEPVQQNPVKAPIAKANAVPVMLVEGVHGRPSLIRGRHDSPPSSQRARLKCQGYQGQSPWLDSVAWAPSGEERA